MNKKVLMLILDGWGMGQDNDHNAINLAKPAYWQELWTKYPHTTLNAKEEAVGLPAGCLSGSEVGHLTLGAGRVVWQGAAQIERSIQTGEFFKNEVLAGAAEHLTQFSGNLHLVGLLSDGGVHAHINHLLALIQWAKENTTQKIYLDLYLDGRDMAAKSALGFFEEKILPELNDQVILTTLCGRAISMDRSENWDRTRQAFDLLTTTTEQTSLTPLTYISASYEEGLTDEFMSPGRFHPAVISNNDAVIFFNFRADRMRQMVNFFLGQAPHNEQAKVVVPNNLHFVSLSEYDAEFKTVQVMFPPTYPTNTLGEWLSTHQIKQFRLAETEKYAHVTYFFNGGREQEFPGEERMIIPSLGLTNYASRPEMSLGEIVATLKRVIARGDHHFVVANFANGDVVGHSGDLDAGILAVQAVDVALAEIVPVAEQNGYTVVITADHGNIEKMKENDEPHTAHTFNDVPLIVTDNNISLTEIKNLFEVAPLILKIMDLPCPPEMSRK